MGLFSPDGIAALLLRLPALLWALSFHEFCHGYAARRLGDKTAEMAGRLSLNPLDHLDPVGTLMLLFFRFGWAKPVPINSRYFKKPRRDIVIVSLAGPAGNFVTAFAVGLLIRAFPQLLAPGALRTVIVDMIFVNIGLGVFNLIPIPPLDGSKVLAMALPPRAINAFFLMERFGMLIILALSMTGILQLIMNPLMLAAYHIVLLDF